jgi:hypothetical protein
LAAASESRSAETTVAWVIAKGTPRRAAGEGPNSAQPEGVLSRYHQQSPKLRSSAWRANVALAQGTLRRIAADIAA